MWAPRALARIARKIDLLSEAQFRWIDQALHTADPSVSAGQRNRATRSSQASRTGFEEDDEKPDPHDQIDDALGTCRLVLVDGPAVRRVYWDQDRVLHQWRRSNKQWELLRMLAKAAGGSSQNRQVSSDMVEREAEYAIVDHRSRLKKLLPGSLDSLIQIGTDPRSYQLNLPRDAVKVLELDADDWLVAEPGD
jgi:hypothetical protein